MNNYDVIVRPIVTEKSVKTTDAANTVVFEVAQGCNKIEVKEAVEKVFNVKVAKVNIVNTKPKAKRYGKYTGMTSSVRKAYVKLAGDSKIDVFSI